MKDVVCILIPHYNNPAGLYKTLASLNGSATLCVLIIDDGSEGEGRPARDKIEQVSNPLNAEIIVEYQEINRGIEYVLNKGLDIIRSKHPDSLVMRIDAGDLATHDRIEKQVKFLNKNPDIGLVGSNVEYVNEHGKHLFNLSLPLTHEEIKKRMLLSVPFIHSAVMFRSNLLRQVPYYSTDYPAAEDYDFFLKLISICNTANIPDILTIVEWHNNGISMRRRRQQLNSRLRLILNNFSWSVNFFRALIRISILIVIPYSLIEKIKKISYQ